jgi:hypothetical protein
MTVQNTSKESQQQGRIQVFTPEENRSQEAHPVTPLVQRATFRCGGVFRELSDAGSERPIF